MPALFLAPPQSSPKVVFLVSPKVVFGLQAQPSTAGKTQEPLEAFSWGLWQFISTYRQEPRTTALRNHGNDDSRNLLRQELGFRWVLLFVTNLPARTSSSGIRNLAKMAGTPLSGVRNLFQLNFWTELKPPDKNPHQPAPGLSLSVGKTWYDVIRMAYSRNQSEFSYPQASSTSHAVNVEMESEKSNTKTSYDLRAPTKQE